jgi:drug/metabolite transporter (DMT)-like permease
MTRENIRCGITVGIAIFLGFALQTVGAVYTTPAKNGVYTGLYVIFVPLAVMMMRRKFLLKPLLLALLCFSGVAILSNAFADLTYTIGDFLTTLCAVAFAVQFILLEKYAVRLPPVNFTIIQLATVAMISLIISICFESDRYAVLKIDQYLAMIVFLGLLLTGVSGLIQTYVQSKISANVVAVVSCTESVFALIFSLIFGYDALSMTLFIGSALIVAAMMLSSMTKQNIANPEAGKG